MASILYAESIEFDHMALPVYDEDEHFPILSKAFEEKLKDTAKQFNSFEQLD